MHERIERWGVKEWWSKKTSLQFEQIFANTVLYVRSKEDCRERETSKCRVPETTEFSVCPRINKGSSMVGEKKAGSRSKREQRKGLVGDAVTKVNKRRSKEQT